MIGCIVVHQIFGTGTILRVDESLASAKCTITVQFKERTTRFVFPDALGTFLSSEDPALLDAAGIWRQKSLPKKETTVTVSKTPEQEKQRPRPRKQIERQNIAFKCNFCDGGSSDSRVGFSGVCSDSMIAYNVGKAKHVWCASDSPCHKYYAGEITRAELEEIRSNSDKEIVCYECEMLTAWQARAGVVQTGANKGRPMRLAKVEPCSLAVLTTRKPYAPDDTRFIFAAFLVSDSYEGDGKEEGFVGADPAWRLELTPTEAEKMLFWNYYFCPNAPEVIRFGSGLHRYLDNVQAAQILRDIITVKTDPAEKEKANDLYLYFCRISGQDPESIPAPNGALKRNEHIFGRNI